MFVIACTCVGRVGEHDWCLCKVKIALKAYHGTSYIRTYVCFVSVYMHAYFSMVDVSEQVCCRCATQVVVRMYVRMYVRNSRCIRSTASQCS